MSVRPEPTPPRPVAAAPAAEDPAFRLFLDGDAPTIAHAMRIVEAIVRFRNYGVPPHERSDSVQDVLLHLWRAIAAPGFSFRNSFDGLVRAIAYRRCIDGLRRRRWVYPLELEPADHGEPVDRRLQREEEEELGRRVIATMRGPCRELFRLHALEDRSYAEIARLQGRSEMALRTQMSACLREARVVLCRLRSRGVTP